MCFACFDLVRAVSGRHTTVPIAPPGGGEKYELLLFMLFRPLCPAFSFADVDTYVHLVFFRRVVVEKNTSNIYIYAKLKNCLAFSEAMNLAYKINSLQSSVDKFMDYLLR